MSGIFYRGQWIENSGMTCPKCGGRVYGQIEWLRYPGAPQSEPIPNYYCPTCKGTLYDPVEPTEPLQPSHFIIGYFTWVNGTDQRLTFIKDEIFDNEDVANAWLLSHGSTSEELDDFLFIDVTPLDGSEFIHIGESEMLLHDAPRF